MRLGCDLVQGYYLSRPVPADALQLDWREPARHIVGLLRASRVTVA
jgi:EAL domain-containing protein (putative c-di-GMP-specific phosphodiesterase class I)